MTLTSSTYRTEIEKMCVELSVNPLLVQGAGGNISWKEGDILWVKASGTALSEASVKDIFLPIDLLCIRHAITAGRFDISPIVKSETKLYPSIETYLHAVIPHRVVLHLHAVDALCHLVRNDAHEVFRKLFPEDFSFITVDYFKPGAELGSAVYQEIKANRNLFKYA